ncbi:hypothetical protein [Methylobacterium sp. ID0610]|uniref:hypothetical protein n=1 Tax=Methylobacterium carpenticola TaxID=3344827 RepID=UPI00367423D1
MSDIDRSIHAFPTPQAIARLMASHGPDAVASRYWFMHDRERSDRIRVGRILLGWDAPATPRVRASTPAQEAAAIETAYAIGEMRAAEVAAGMGPNGIRAAFVARGLLDMPRISGELRGRATQDSKDAARGDATAAARIESRRAHAEAVYAVCVAALALVPEQPAAGRPRLPEPTPALAAALAGFERTAVLAVFPTLPNPPAPEPAPEEPSMPVPAQPSPKRVVPPDDVIRVQHAETPSPKILAAMWGTSQSAVFTHLRRLGLTRPRGGVRLPVPVAPRSPDEDPSIGVHPLPGEPRFLGRLGVEDLALAIELARRAEISPMDALTWVRADAGLAAADAERTA